MAFGISGFGGEQLAAAPQIFQALSLGGKPPVPPAPPYGTPNPNLVPVAHTTTPALPANLTLAAHPVFDAILKLTSQGTVAFGHPDLQPSLPNTTTGIATTNPTVGLSISGPVYGGLPQIGNPPEGPVSFGLTVAPANVTSGLDVLTKSTEALNQGIAEFQQSQQQTQPQQQSQSAQTEPAPPSQTTQTAQPLPAQNSSAQSSAATSNLPAAQPALVAKIVQSVQTLAVSAIYGGPVFSFSA